jgi:hypothetical protein
MDNWIRGLNLFNLASSSIGLFLFGAVFLLVQFAPADLDVKVRDYAIGRVQDRVETRLQDEDVDAVLSSAQNLAGRFSSRLEDRVASARGALDTGVPELIAEIVSQICEYDCERSAEVEANIRQAYEANMARYGLGLDRLRAFVEGEYQQIVNALKAELRLFSAINFVALLAVFLVGLMKARAAVHLVPASSILLIATLASASWYLLGQNWLLAILFSDYWGWGYAGLIAVLFGMLVDIVLFKATVTTQVLNGLGSALGGAFQISPC